MVYDNAQLARVYLHAWRLTSERSQAMTGNEFFRTITEEILDYVVREMLDPHGGFYSTQDADREGEEGKFFVWTLDEIREVLAEDTEEFIAAYSVSPHGNFEGKNILECIGDMDQRPTLAEARRRLFEAREQRVQALAYTLSKPRKIAIVGDPDAADTQALLSVVRDGYRPFQVVHMGAPEAQPPPVPLLQDRGLVDGQATTYVCQAFACQAPVTKPAKLQAQLAPR